MPKCEKCGKIKTEEFSDLIDGKWYCYGCGSAINMLKRISDRCINHRYECTCHECITMIENGYKKKNNEWIKT